MGLADGFQREYARLVLVKKQLRELVAQQREAVRDNAQPQVAQLAHLRSIGLRSAWVLVTEVFGWRRFPTAPA